MNKIFNWKRYWCKQGGTTALDFNGFLLDPETANNLYQKTDVVAFDKIEDTKCLILLGEQGIGKSVILENQYNDLIADSENDKILLYRNLNEYGDEKRLIDEIFKSDEIKQWLLSQNEIVVLLDSFDECQLRIPNLGHILKSRIKVFGDKSSQIYLRIACRTGMWPESLTEFLRDFWGGDNVGTYEMSPLTLKDVVDAANGNELDTEIFTKEIINKEVQPLAIKPLTLNFLIQEFKSKGYFSTSKEGLFYNGCKLLCTEPNFDRLLTYKSDGTSPERKIALASRIAAISILCNKPIIDLKSPCPKNDESITIDMLLEGEEHTENYSFQFTQQDLIETITQSALFSSKGNMCFGFADFTYTEFLAAKFIANHHLDIEQIKSLITISSDAEGKIIPQVKGMAAWLAVLESNFTEFVIEHDPQNLLYGDLDSINYENKKKLVKSILEKLDNTTIDDSDWGLRNQYRKLYYPDLSEDLKHKIQDKNTCFLVRRAAIEIATECGLTDLNDSLLILALNPNENIYMRSNAVSALTVLGNDELKKRLMPLAVEPQSADLKDELKGYSLLALWPKQLTNEQIFNVLTPPKQDNYAGAYARFIYTFRDKITDDDLDAGLKWILKYIDSDDDNNYRFERIEDTIIFKSWQNYEKIRDKTLFAKALLPKMEQYQLAHTLPQYISDNTRINVFTEIIKIIDKDELHLLSHNGLISTSDFNEIFDIFLKEKTSEIKAKLSIILFDIFNFFKIDTGHLDLIMSNYYDNEELKKSFQSIIEPVEIESPAAQNLRNKWKQRKKWEQEIEKQPNKDTKKKIDIYERLEHTLTRFELNGDVNDWIQFYLDLTIDEVKGRYTNELKPNVLLLPNWKYVDEPIKERIINASEYYVQNFNDNHTEWFGTKTYYRPAAAGYKSLILLWQLKPSFIKTLVPDHWKSWRYILLDHPESYGITGEDKTYLDLIEFAYTKIPKEMIDVFREKIENANKKGETYLTFIHKLERCSDSMMLQALISLLQEETLIPAIQNQIFIELLGKGNREAFELIKNMIAKSNGELKVQLAKALASFCDDETWEFIMSYVQKDTEFGKDFFLNFVDLHIVNMLPLFDRITENQCADLYIWLSNAFPREEDPVFGGAHTVGARESVGEFRNSILRALTGKGTQRAIDALNLVKETKPNFNVDSYLITAKINFRRSNWEPLKPIELLKLAYNKKTRIIRDPDDLINLIIESLIRIETKLQGDNSQSMWLWDKIPDKERKYTPKSEEILSEYVKDRLDIELKMNGISSFREVQLRRPNKVDGGKAGEKVDILVSYTHPNTKESFTVIIEIKGSWNDSVNTNMQQQLCDRYLKVGNCVHGIYLVGWYNCTAYDNCQNKTGRATLKDAKAFYQNEANKLSNDGKAIKSFVLDCSLRN